MGLLGEPKSREITKNNEKPGSTCEIFQLWGNRNMVSMQNTRVMFNISGEIYETFTRTLQRFPHTLLGDPRQLKTFYCIKTNIHFFNRNRHCFGAILYFYQSHGNLSCPCDMSVDVMEEECRFFQIPSDSVQRMKMKQGIISDLLDGGAEDEPSGGSLSWRRRMWNIVESPETSSVAQTFAILSLSAILLSTIFSCLKTISYFSRAVPWTQLEFALNAWFLLELLSRLLLTPRIL